MSRTLPGAPPSVLTLVLTLLACAAALPARSSALDPETAAYERLERTVEALYERARSSAEAAVGNTRGDVADAINDCRYLGQFESLEMLDYERIDRDLERCMEQVAERYPDHPEVVLYQLEAMSGQALIGEAEAVLERGQAVGWTNRQAARLYESLAYAYAEQNLERAGYYANAAVQLDLFSPARDLAVRWLIDAGQADAAKLMLSAPRLNGPRNLANEIPLLFELGAEQLALERYAQLTQDGAEYYDELALARVLLEYEQFEPAKAQYAAAVRGDWFNDYKAQVLYERLRIALQRDDREDAISTYDTLRGESWEHDPLLRLRLMLARAYPDLPWTWRELPGALAIVGVLLAAVLLPLLMLIAPVHYRGLMRQHAAKPRRPTPFAWRLEHAWLAMSLAMILNLAAAYAFDPTPWGPGLPAGESPVADAQGDGTVSDITVAALGANALVALMLLPFCGGIPGLQRLVSSRWNWRKTLTTVFASWIGLRVLAAILIAGFGLQVGMIGTLLAQVTELQKEIYTTIEAIGLVPSVILMGVVAPLSEELLFRGVLLSAFARHLSFHFANLLQALLFAVIHGELLLSPFFLAMGLVAGWTVRRTGGLRAAVLLHILNNLVAVVLRVALTSLKGDS